MGTAGCGVRAVYEPKRQAAWSQHSALLGGFYNEKLEWQNSESLTAQSGKAPLLPADTREGAIIWVQWPAGIAQLIPLKKAEMGACSG